MLVGRLLDYGYPITKAESTFMVDAFGEIIRVLFDTVEGPKCISQEITDLTMNSTTNVANMLDHMYNKLISRIVNEVNRAVKEAG